MSPSMVRILVVWNTMRLTWRIVLENEIQAFPENKWLTNIKTPLLTFPQYFTMEESIHSPYRLSVGTTRCSNDGTEWQEASYVLLSCLYTLYQLSTLNMILFFLHLTLYYL